MSRTIFRTPCRRLPAFVRVLLAALAILVVLAPTAARAVTPYSIHWVDTQAPGSCVTADLGHNDGKAFFHVNDVPVPTYQVPGALVTNADGSTSNVAEAGFDSVLLRTGPNDFLFSVFAESGDDTCVHAHDLAHLISVPLGIDKPLFDLQRNGTGFVGSSQVDLKLAEINPPLAQDIANLEAALKAEREELLAHASEVADLAWKLDALKQLDAELHDLVTRPLDEITPEDLAEILDRYANVVDAATRAALEQLLADVQKSLDDLRAELASLIDEFGAQADAAADLVTGTATASGYNPDDPWGYGLGFSDVPPVEIPDVSGVPGAFDPGNDPYDAYAQAVIAALAEDVVDGKVTARADFVAQVRAWRANDKAIGKALAEGMNVSQAEVSAFLKAETKVTSYVHQFLDAQDWFNDSTVPADVRATVDGVLKNKFAELDEQLKDSLNILGPDAIDLTDTRLFKTIVAFGGAMSAVENVALPYFEMMATLVQGTERIAIGFVPFVGPTLDFCEAVTGRAWCMPDGEELSTEERIFSGAGVAVGSVATFWAGVKGAGVGAKAAAVAGAVAEVDQDLAKGLRAQALAKPNKFRGAMKAVLGASEDRTAKHMRSLGEELWGLGDDGVRGVLDMPMTPTKTKAPDFLTRLPDEKFVLTEVKWPTDGALTLDFNQIDTAKKQLLSGAAAFQAKPKGNLASYVRIAVPKGTTLPEGYMLKNGYLYLADGKPEKVGSFFVQLLEVPTQ